MGNDLSQWPFPAGMVKQVCVCVWYITCMCECDHCVMAIQYIFIDRVKYCMHFKYCRKAFAPLQQHSTNQWSSNWVSWVDARTSLPWRFLLRLSWDSLWKMKTALSFSRECEWNSAVTCKCKCSRLWTIFEHCSLYSRLSLWKWNVKYQFYFKTVRKLHLNFNCYLKN